MTKMMFIEKMVELGIEINEYQLKQLDIYFHMLIEWNKKINLTAITDEDEVYEKHFYDSILTSQIYDFNDERICDVGAGAGFPSIPLKIVFPKLKITIVDSLNKRIVFLNELVRVLSLDDVNLIHARAEELVSDYRNNFDIVMARAVARLNVLSELCLPLLKKDGYFLVLKGKDALNEIEEASNAINKLDAKLEEYKKYYLIDNNDVSYLIRYKKVKDGANKYPRLYSQIKKKPL